jgi:diguanylate cyclase (GGDEF)-like protein
MSELEQIFDTINLGLVILDRDLKVRHWNRWMARCSKIEPEQILGRRVFDFFPTLEANQSFQRNCKSVLAFGSYAFFSQKLHRYLFPFPPTSSFEVKFEQMQQSCTMGPLRDDGRAITGIFLTVEDMTESAANEQRLDEMTSKDALTGVYNRRYLETRIREEFGRHRRYSRRLTLVMFDIDHFKMVNDNHGHPCGDFILQSVAGAIANRIRLTDCLARYGGEEFSCLLQETDLTSGMLLAERFRRQVEEMDHDFKGTQVKVTISLGVSELKDDDTLEQFVKRADEAMYRAKTGGRNRVCGPDPGPYEKSVVQLAPA